MSLAEKLAGWSAGLKYSDLTPEAVHEVKRRLIDSTGTALGAYHSRPAAIGREAAAEVPVRNGAVVFGTRLRTAPPLAALCNGAHVRYLDYNDTYLSREPAHPSDNIPATLAVAQSAGATGRDFILATVIAYEIQCRLCDAASLRKNGWDHVFYVALASALGAARLWKCNSAAMVHALGLAGVCNIATRQTRTGQISMWKACAASNAARGGVLAANLARRGFTGPHEIFEGPKGVFKMLTGGPFDVELGSRSAGYMINRTYIKFWPAEYHAQSAIDAALQIRRELHAAGQSAADIERMEIESFEAAVSIIGSEPEKWRPTSRETADHSMGYMVCAALYDGDVTKKTFEPKRFTDPKVLSLLDRTAIREAEDLNPGYPAGIPNRLLVTLKDGRRLEKRVDFPRGHAGNPMSDEEVERKFRTLATGVISEKTQDALLKQMWSIDKAKHVRDVWSFNVARKGSARKSKPKPRVRR
ncbi:MAG: MmgE/PrpD family protein [Phycisphaerae bacterium]|nr:MmgE/PrpD family protein [Phycisphaerae bacterium]NUQ46270.1 MmgE/PrpD family protein [Phycisphaerae bacterium]